MPVWIVTGNLGGGKTLCCVGKIQDYALAGRRIATNLDINVCNMFPWSRKKLDLIRLPDKPTVADFNIIGKGTESLDEKHNGLIVLDECGTWFNSRTWGDKDRQPLIDWLLHSRKKGWDILFIIQDISLFDKQVRTAIAEHTVYCRRLDRLNIPFIGALFSLIFNDRLPLPRIHVGIVRYGNNDKALIVDRWVYRGNALFNCYNTRQLFTDNYINPPFVNGFGEIAGSNPMGCYSFLPPWHVRGWRQIKLNGENLMRLTKIYFKTMRIPSAFALGAAIVLAFHFYTAAPVISSPGEAIDLERFRGAKVVSFASFPGSGSRAVIELEDKKIVTSDELTASGLSISGNGRRLVISGGGRDVTLYR